MVVEMLGVLGLYVMHSDVDAHDTGTRCIVQQIKALNYLCSYSCMSTVCVCAELLYSEGAGVHGR